MNNTSTNGHSYEVLGNWIGPLTYPRKSLRSVNAYVHVRASLPGIISGPSDTFVIMDRLEVHPAYHENTPNPYDGHGADGANVVFADNHVEWIGIQDWNYRFELSQDEGRQLNPY
jgi:prepilin-type processing-associated H-X9-DG protein